MKDNKNSENQMQYLPIGMCIGISIGTAIGAATDNIGVGMCLGVGFGTMLGALLDAQKRKTVNKETPEQEVQTEEDQQKTEE